jgi:1,4-dihydroxy-2-naphthoate octaprenyltransferase
VSLPLLLRSTRAYSFPASIVSILVGTALALSIGHRFDLLTFSLLLLGGVLAHAGANVLNDFFDFRHGVDTRPEHGSGVLTDGTLTERQMGRLGWGLLAAAALCGLLLAVRHQSLYGAAVWMPVLVLAAIGLGCAVLYPLILKRYALGDVLVMVAFGVGLTLGSYLLQTGGMTPPQFWYVVLISLPATFLIDAILNANNLRDRVDDRAAHVRTLANLLSERGGLALQAFLLFAPPLFVVLGVARHFLPPWSLLALLSLPLLVRSYRELNVPLTAMAHLAFGLPYALAFLLPK